MHPTKKTTTEEKKHTWAEKLRLLAGRLDEIEARNSELLEHAKELQIILHPPYTVPPVLQVRSLKRRWSGDIHPKYNEW